MPVRLTNLAKRLFRRPSHKPRSIQLGCETLEARTVPAQVYQGVFDWAGMGGTARVTATVTDDTPGQYRWEYHVENTGFTPGPGQGIGMFIVRADDASGVGDLGSSVGWDGYVGGPTGEPNIVHWWNLGSSADDILAGESGTFWFTTPVVLIEFVSGEVYDSGYAAPAGGDLAVPGQPAVFDLDVNANGSLADAVDLAANYLPGYEGTTPKVSTGTSFNVPGYSPQQMKLILDGIGWATPGVTQVTFELVQAETTTHAGYASNRTDPAVDAAGAKADYSFHPNFDASAIVTPTSVEPVGDLPVGGVMEPNRTWVYFYAKDYGGATQVKATVYRTINGFEQAQRFTLDVPKDTDADGIADKWEIAMAARWSAQYLLPAYTDAQALQKFSPGGVAGHNQDDEEQDPDGIGTGRNRLVPQAEIGDAHTVLEEYRGYILDGGGLDGVGANGHPGGHVRLDPARKEILVEVDRAAVINNLPDVPGVPGWLQTDELRFRNIMNGASSVFSNADRGAGIYMYYLFDELALDLPKEKVDIDEEVVAELGLSRDTAQARTAATPNLANDFIHLVFVDDMANIGGGAATNDLFGTLPQRGSMVAVSNLMAKQAEWGLNPAKFNEMLMCAAAHEITHLLLERRAGTFDAGEHTINPNGDGVRGDAEDKTCLMYTGLPTRGRLELATVNFFPVVQVELRVKTNQAFHLVLPPL